MKQDRVTLRWNGWGLLEAPNVLGEHGDAIWQWIGNAMGVQPLPHTPAKPLEEILLPPIRQSDDLVARFVAALDDERVKTDKFERAFHARGKSYHDTLHLRAGRIDTAPDLVVYPRNSDECVAIACLAAAERLALIPFGGGSSVVGGVNAMARPDQRGIVTVDLTLMDRVLEIDEESLVARVQAGVYGPHLEEQLQARGYTLGHYPQSFEFSTLGGWIAPRGAGHQSNKYGKAEEWLVEAEIATPGGLWRTQGFPGSAAGPQLRDLIAGSEGVLGIITEATVKLHRVPEKKDYRGYLFMDYAAAVTATRTLMQADVPTAMIRLSDYDETFFYATLKTGGQGPDPSMRFCVMLVGIEGEVAEVEHAVARSRAIVEQHGGVHMGEELGQSWYKGRFDTPYLRDPLMDHGLGVDTLETCTRWSNLLPLHEKVTRAIQGAMAARPGTPGARGICMAHISHCYHDGASLYFTFVFPRDLEDETGQWWAIKRTASEVILANGGTISHHHGVGMDHIEWYHKELGATGLAALRAAKEALDPDGVMNPGKLLLPLAH